ncbi:sulfatase-like hydrolase/transferase [Novosphingobium sp. SG707]|uniref:sulfatase-like hydrolase/transferase n=1 Tax=Novosphingobium sp. SG707 TaxID=2586996 RepID=UPI001445C41B|nr:sulfatase-like hydrolase/transferase [Novosphingobium sp. SG707]NKI98797.1 arylsulfatase A-like enzyme [Novosphingobium sp. SG707]
MKCKANRLALALTLLWAAPAMAGEVAGSVTGPDGKPMAGLRLTIPELMRETTTDSEGHYRFDTLPAGAMSVSASVPFLAPVHQTVDVPATGQVSANLTMAPNRLLAGAAAMRGEPAVEHAAQKQAYLDQVAKAAAHGRKMNVVVLLFDDLGYGDLSSYGNTLIRTPNIDALATRGARLTQAYSGSPVCTPSRAALLTGRLPHRSGAAHHVFFPSDHPMATLRRSLGWANALPRDEITLAEVMGKAGYATGAFGKWHLGDVAGSRPNDLGFQTYFGVHYSNDMKPLAIYRNQTVDTASAQTRQETLNERFADEAISFIGQNRDRPFFAYVPFTAPHWPHVANPAHSGQSRGGLYGDVVEDLDHQVGRIVKALDEMHLSENTLLVVTSDNGGDYDGSVGNLRGRKGEVWEGGMRVPAFVIWPHVTRPGAVVDGMAMNVDLFPTILGMNGIPMPTDRAMDGKDLRPMLAGQAANVRDTLFYTTTWTGKLVAVRDNRFKFIEPFDDNGPMGGAAGRAHPIGPALYDLAADNESQNVIGLYPDRAKALQQALAAMQQQAQSNPRGWLTP